MAIIYAQDVVECAIKGTYAGRPVVNVLHFKNDEGAISDVAKARDLFDNWQDHMTTYITDAYVIDSMEWRSLDPDDTNVGSLAPDPAKRLAGLVNGDGFPPNVAYLVKKQTTNRPRGRRDGRIFMAGVPELAVNDDGTVPAGTITAWQVELDAFINGVNDDAWGAGGGSGLVVLETTPESRVPGSMPVTLNSRAVTGLVLDGRVATQRDRLR